MFGSRRFVLSVFNSMLPGTLVLVLGFFSILHSWLNAFAEMMTFADRMFYKVINTVKISGKEILKYKKLVYCRYRKRRLTFRA